jgi:Spy/CpxP family protein refolding chaperone
MRKTMILTAVITVLAGAALYAGPGRAHMRGAGGPHGFGFGGFFGHLHDIADELDLTKAQKTQIHGIFMEARDENKQYREQLHGGFVSVAKTLVANPNDVSGAQALLDQQDAAERAMKANMLRAASKALNVLTPEQRTELAQLIAERENRRGN